MDDETTPAAIEEEAEDQASEDIRPEEEEEQEEPTEEEASAASDEPFDKDRAMRTIKRQRAEEKKRKEEADQLRRERDELRQASESEQERNARERDEAKAEAERERAARRHMAIDLALRDAAADEDIAPKKVKRLLKMVDRDALSVDQEGVVEGAGDAIADLLEEFPEFRAERPDPSEEGEQAPARRTPGGNPDRKRSRDGGELTAKDAARMAREDPDRFIQLMEEGKIGREQMGGKQLDRLRDEGRISTTSADNEHGVTPAPHVRN